MIHLNIIITSVRPEHVEDFGYFVLQQAHHERYFLK